ncbi:MAG: DsbE family thiol:disulfide interchange protein [Proteobacteria bacterium]|nr:DsbE family thiol:disulfide interchange protein [Pseudomonadota bacterium]
MNRFLLPLGIFGLLVVVLVIGIRHSPEKGIIASPLIGRSAPEFSLPALMQPGGTVSTASFKGRWYLLNVWGTWCGECRNEHAMLLRIKENGAVPLVGLDWKDDDAQAQAWLAQLGNPYESIGADRSGRVAIDYGVYGAPETFLINPQGIVVFKQVGAITEEVWTGQILPRVKGQGSR